MSRGEPAMNCARCGRRLLPGGKPEQRPRPVPVPGMDDDGLPVYEMVCGRCAGENA